jgi:hypothetical protein
MIKIKSETTLLCFAVSGQTNSKLMQWDESVEKGRKG